MSNIDASTIIYQLRFNNGYIIYVGGVVMGQLYDLKQKIESLIEAKSLDAVKVKGQIGLKAGFMLAFISPSTPDDNAKAEKLKAAAKEVLNVSL